MSKFTPGPWKVGRHLGSRQEVRLIHYDAADKGQGIPIIEGAVTESNARLIASAPDLLAALQSVWLWMENQADAQSKGGHATFDLMKLREQRDIASAAIAKATGETP